MPQVPEVATILAELRTWILHVIRSFAPKLQSKCLHTVCMLQADEGNASKPPCTEALAWPFSAVC